MVNDMGVNVKTGNRFFLLSLPNGWLVWYSVFNYVHAYVVPEQVFVLIAYYQA